MPHHRLSLLLQVLLQSQQHHRPLLWRAVPCTSHCSPSADPDSAVGSPGVASPLALSPAPRGSPALLDPAISRLTAGQRTPTAMSPGIRPSGDSSDAPLPAVTQRYGGISIEHLWLIIVWFSGYAAGSLEAELIAARTVSDEIIPDAEGLRTLMV